MGDSAAGSSAWVIDPHRYLGGRPAEHGVRPPISRYLEMRDGVRLAVDVHLPDGVAGPVPAVLIFTPYYRRFRLAPGSTAEASPNSAAYREMFVPRGYALVVVDVRGTGASFGCRDSFRSPAERADHAEVIEWVATQPWCDGRLGATGISYLGAAADFAASSGHPALKAIAPISAVWDTYRDHFYPGGCFLSDVARGYAEVCDAMDQDRRDVLRRFHYFTDPSLQGPAPVDDDPEGALLVEAIAGHAANAQMQDFLREFQFRDSALPHDPRFNSDSFSPHAVSTGMREDLAVLSISGWMDGAYTNGAISRFLSAPGRERRLLLGPWDHGARANVSPFRNRPLPEFPLLGEILRFFDTHVRGLDTGLADEAPVHFHTMRSERWQSADGWPAAGGCTVLHLGANGTLAREAGGAGEVDYHANFRSGTGENTRWGRLQIRNVQDYYDDWPARSEGHLAFRSAALPHETTIAGHALLSLPFACSQADACIYAYLEDIAPDGRRRYVTEGMLRALHRAGEEVSDTYRAAWPLPSFRRADAAPLAPGERVRLVIPLLPTAWAFPEGHRIGLRLAGADRDNFTLWPYGRPGHWRIGTGPDGGRLSLPVA